MQTDRYLIVNADDYGRSPGVNRGIIQAHELGIVTSASLMVRWPQAAEAAAYARQHQELSLGLHIDLSEWSYQEGEWVPLYEVVPFDDADAVKQELARQMASFQQMVGQNPTHFDSHQHVHLREPLRSILLSVSDEMNVPVRDLCPAVCYCGEFYGQTWDGSPYPEGITVQHLISTLEKLPGGATEMGCHPSAIIDFETMYGAERMQELKALCDPRVRAAISRLGIRLCSFRELRA